MVTYNSMKLIYVPWIFFPRMLKYGVKDLQIGTFNESGVSYVAWGGYFSRQNYNKNVLLHAFFAYYMQHNFIYRD